MSYINLIKDFWHRQQENPLRPADIALYLYLAEVCNSRSWPATFALSNKHLQLALDFSAKTLLNARQAFDEVGRESSSSGHFGNNENVMLHILQRRYDLRDGDFTHVTSNLSLDQIAQFYGEHIYDRCIQMFNFVEMSGASFRN